MEEDQELMIKQQHQQHLCKFCSKCFPCGRSLGGHMRSHITNNNTSSSAETEDREKEKVVVASSEAGTGTGYGLRENPKKTWRIADSSGEDTLFTLTAHKFCKECGKGFHSWKALFGHMKCHSDKERVSINNNNHQSLVEDQDSVTNNNNAQKLVMDSQSDNEATAPSKRRRSKRRRTRYMVPLAATTTNLSSSSSVYEVEQEQEEVAMSLIMLSRDLSPWSGLNNNNNNNNNPVADFSDNSSAYFKTSPSVQTENEIKMKAIADGSEIAKAIEQSEKKLEFGNLVSGNVNSKGKKSSELLDDEFIKSEKSNKCELDYVSALEDCEEDEHRKNRLNGTESVFLSKSTITNKYSSIKTRFLGSSESKSKSLKIWINKPSEPSEEAEELSKSNSHHKRGKFECTTCNKIFHSYQALGGHRASHKRNKSCFVSKNESSENSIEIETELSPDPTTESSKIMMKKNSESEYIIAEPEVEASVINNEVADTVNECKKNKVHECPICFKVFQSGQALGGHKRSHVASGSESNNNKNFQKVEAVPEIREFLDLNLPPAAATEEESGTSHADSNRPWWLVESNHKQEATLVGLMSI